VLPGDCTCLAAEPAGCRACWLQCLLAGAVAKGDEAPPCMRWRGLAVCLAARVAGYPATVAARRLPRGPSLPIARLLCAAWRHRCQIPAVGAGLPALPAFPGSPPGRIPSSVVRDFYCESSAQHKAFPREVQDSLVIHKTSVVYPLCTTNLHWIVHNLSTATVDKRPGQAAWTSGLDKRPVRSCEKVAGTNGCQRPAGGQTGG
jgi:hypothetical protein